MNQQRPITETRYPIDQTIPHQLVVSKILGALLCHPALRIIQHDGPRPFATPTDALADLRGSCDIAVSLDGSMKYGLVIEAKTTAHSEGGAWKIFKAVREERRNALQFERLVNAAPRWWYLIVRTDKLTAKTHEEHDRNLLDCPAILVDGKQGDQVPEDFIGPLRFGEMLQLLGDRLHISSSMPIKMSSREQLAFPIDDVPVVSMETPLNIVKPEPVPAQRRNRQDTPNMASSNTQELPTILSESASICMPHIVNVTRRVGLKNLEARLSAEEQAHYKRYCDMFINNLPTLDSINSVRAEFGGEARSAIRNANRIIAPNHVVCMLLAIQRRSLDQGEPTASGWESSLRFPEFTVYTRRRAAEQRLNIAVSMARVLVR